MLNSSNLFGEFKILRDSQLIHLGKCSKPHGLKGEFSLNLINHEFSNLSDGLLIILKPTTMTSILKNEEEFKIEKIRLGNKAILKLETIDSIEQAQDLIPFDIYIDKNNLPSLAAGEYYLSDLIGFKVLDESHDEFGIVFKFGFNGAQDILVIKAKNGALEEIPMVKPFLQHVDLVNKTIRIQVPDYI